MPFIALENLVDAASPTFCCLIHPVMPNISVLSLTPALYPLPHSFYCFSDSLSPSEHIPVPWTYENLVQFESFSTWPCFLKPQAQFSSWVVRKLSKIRIIIKRKEKWTVVKMISSFSVHTYVFWCLELIIRSKLLIFSSSSFSSSHSSSPFFVNSTHH